MRRLRDPFTHTPEGTIERWLSSDDPADAAFAEEALAGLDPDQAHRLMRALLERERNLRRRGGRVAGLALWGGLSGTSLLLGALIEFPVLAAMLGSVSGPAVLFLYGLRPSRLQRRVWERLARAADPCGIPLLLDAWMPWERDVHEVVTRGLTRLLPRLTADDRDLLTAAQWARLETLLRAGAAGHGGVDDELTRAALRALGNVRPAGARAALESVAYLGGAPGDLTAEQARLREMARNYLLAWDGPRPHISPPACPEPVRVELSQEEPRVQTVGRRPGAEPR